VAPGSMAAIQTANSRSRSWQVPVSS